MGDVIGRRLAQRPLHHGIANYDGLVRLINADRSLTGWFAGSPGGESKAAIGTSGC